MLVVHGAIGGVRVRKDYAACHHPICCQRMKKPSEKTVVTVAARLRRVRGDHNLVPWRESDYQDEWIRLARHVLRKGYKP